MDYSKLVTISIAEHDKIMATINSVDMDNTTLEQFTYYYKFVYNMLSRFAENLDKREQLLKCDFNIFKLSSSIKAWKKYKKYALLLINDLTKQFESWTTVMKSFKELDTDAVADTHIRIQGLI